EHDKVLTDRTASLSRELAVGATTSISRAWRFSPSIADREGRAVTAVVARIRRGVIPPSLFTPEPRRLRSVQITPPARRLARVAQRRGPDVATMTDTEKVRGRAPHGRSTLVSEVATMLTEGAR